MDLGSFDVGLGVPGDITELVVWEAPMELRMQPSFKPSKVLPESGSTFDAVQGGEDPEDAVVVDGGVGLGVFLVRLFPLGMAGELRW